MAKAKPETDLEKLGIAEQAAGAEGNAAGETITGEGTGQALPEIVATEVLDMLKGPTIVVKGPAKGRWRIGRHFTSEPTSIPARALNEAQWHALNGDPELLVTVVDPPD
ncbi:hypothetical protein [Cypionkella psychrotolerans]|uniref:hypothetical protein n=1 Tax=Cypionkella psychrotolerans TaxID=1678131 RepID=UPI0006B5B3E6|nr:hypothetical protein [Cypionkella psychrotolerans]